MLGYLGRMELKTALNYTYGLCVVINIFVFAYGASVGFNELMMLSSVSGLLCALGFVRTSSNK